MKLNVFGENSVLLLCGLVFLISVSTINTQNITTTTTHVTSTTPSSSTSTTPLSTTLTSTTPSSTTLTSTTPSSTTLTSTTASSTKLTSTRSTVPPTTTGQTTTKITTIINTFSILNPTFTPNVCEASELEWNSHEMNGTRGANDVGRIHFQSSKSLCITQERASANLLCRFCVTKPVQWASVLWYKNGRLINNEDIDSLRINHVKHNDHEGIYTCKVITSTNLTESKTITLIVNQDPLFSIIPSVWARNLTYTPGTKILWQVRGGGIFDAVKVTIKIRQVDQPTWIYTREYTEFVSGSTELNDLEPSTLYLANISAVTNYGEKAECRSIAFWSSARNSTDFDFGVLSLNYCTRKLIGLITGIVGLIFTIGSILCCCLHPACEFRSHQGYKSPSAKELITQKYDYKDDEKELNHNIIMDYNKDTYINV